VDTTGQCYLAGWIQGTALIGTNPLAAQGCWDSSVASITSPTKPSVQLRSLSICDGSFQMRLHGEHFLRVLEDGTVSTNVYPRRTHNFAIDMGWLPWPVVPKKQWPPVQFGEKRAITLDEHQAIIARERNPERKAFYELAWHIGASQTDITLPDAENIDRHHRVISYARKKTGESASVRFDEEVEQILRSRPSAGPLFPYLRGVREADRATEFRQRCGGLSIKGVTLHSYLYGWAERAMVAGYPERFAQAALGHNSKAVHRAYARNAKVVLPSLASFEKKAQEGKILPFPASETVTNPPATPAKS